MTHLIPVKDLVSGRTGVVRVTIDVLPADEAADILNVEGPIAGPAEVGDFAASLKRQIAGWLRGFDNVNRVAKERYKPLPTPVSRPTVGPPAAP